MVKNGPRPALGSTDDGAAGLLRLLESQGEDEHVAAAPEVDGYDMARLREGRNLPMCQPRDLKRSSHRHTS